MDELIGYIYYSDVPLLLCIYYTGQYNSFGCYSWWTGILFGYEVPLIAYSCHGYTFDGTVSIFLEKHDILQDTILLILI